MGDKDDRRMWADEEPVDEDAFDQEQMESKLDMVLMRLNADADMRDILASTPPGEGQ